MRASFTAVLIAGGAAFQKTRLALLVLLPPRPRLIRSNTP